jgi:hypothetical protein
MPRSLFVENKMRAMAMITAPPAEIPKEYRECLRISGS